MNWKNAAGISNPCRSALLTMDVFYSIGGGFGAGIFIDRETWYGEFRYTFSGDFETVIADLYKAIEGGEFDE